MPSAHHQLSIKQYSVISLVGLLLGAVFYPVFFVSLAWLGLGISLYVGIGLLWLDEYFLNRHYIEPQTEPGNSPENNEVAAKLITRSPLFMLIFVPLALYVVTSSGVVGCGLILGMTLTYFLEMFFLKSEPAIFIARYAQTHQKLSHKEIKWLTLFFGGYLVFLTLLVWFRFIA